VSSSKKRRATSSPREVTPTFSKIAWRWSCTVHDEMESRPAIAFVGSADRSGGLALTAACPIAHKLRLTVARLSVLDPARRWICRIVV
jgi:hypothetical protein